MRSCFFLVFIGWLLTSCNDCPPNVYLGRVSLTGQTKSEIIYTDAKLAIYKNEEGDLLPMKIGNFNRIQLSEGVIVGETCSSAGGNTQIKGDFEYVFGELTWPDSAFNFERALDIGLLYGFQVVDHSPDTVFADVANAYSVLRNQNSPGPLPSYGYLIKVTSDRGHQDDRIDRLNDYTFLADTTILGRRFENVYRPVDNGLIYYSPAMGIVAFRDGVGDLWVLERLE